MPDKVVTRFAPSPTGYMHIGGVRTALYAWAFARKHGGTFILRIEDTDKEREVEGSIDHIITSLKWLGITWDEGPDIGGSHTPYVQSQRLESYKKYAHKLIERGLAYADPYSEEELELFRKRAEETKRPFLYRDYRPENPPAWDGTQPLRLKIVNIISYEWDDLVRGKLKAGSEALDDFVLIKSDGYPTYNFAHIIDDLEMGVTHIMRADEFIASTPKYLALYDALEIKRPHIATLPPIMAPGGKKKLGKRDGAKDILEYRNEGYLPEAMVNFLVFIGWSPEDTKEVFSPDEFIETFSIERIHQSGGGFNEEKLRWLNKEHLKLLSKTELLKKVIQWLPQPLKALPGYSDEKVSLLLPLLLERIEVFSDIETIHRVGELTYFFEKPQYETSLLIPKDISGEETTKYINEVVNILEKTLPWNKESIKNAIWNYASEVGRGKVLWPMRVALSGLAKSPDPFVLAEYFGQAETIERLTIAIEKLKT